MFEKFKKYIIDNNLIKTGDRILMAVSGGIDSMVMAHLILMTGAETGIAHCNFSLRGTDSDLDEAMVRQFASDHKIPFWSVRFDTMEYAVRNKLSVQMAARELRYNWFEEIRDKNGFDSVAVAHNLNDNIETLLINLTRGTGIAGLTGMRSSNNRIIRPVLFATRQSIMEYCHENDIIFREDKTNSENKYLRNKIRHQVIPLLKEINPSIEDTLNDTAEKMLGISEIVSDYTDQIRKNISVSGQNSVFFDIPGLLPFVSNKPVLYEIFKPFSITNSLLTDLKNIITGRNGGQIFTSTHRILKDRKKLIATPDSKHEHPVWIIDKISDLIHVPSVLSAHYENITDDFKISPDRQRGYFDAEKVNFPLTFRNWEPGDYFYPLGMKQKKKLSDYFTDRKMSILEKEKILIMESSGQLVWILGERIDNRHKITSSTKRALVILLKTD